MCVRELPLASVPSLSSGEEAVLKALLQSRALKAGMEALYPDRGKPTVHHLTPSGPSDHQEE